MVTPAIVHDVLNTPVTRNIEEHCQKYCTILTLSLPGQSVTRYVDVSSSTSRFRGSRYALRTFSLAGGLSGGGGSYCIGSVYQYATANFVPHELSANISRWAWAL